MNTLGNTPSPRSGGNSTVSYADIVLVQGFPAELRGRWAVVGCSERAQGWKLHVSSVPSQAERLLSVVLPILRARAVSFKVARDRQVLALLNAGSLGPTQIGKFITVYPPSDAESRSLADELTAATQHFEGPEVITDLRLGRVVYARYGGFNADQERDRLGHVFSVLHDDAGASRRDERAVPFVSPRGVINPFADLVERQRISLNAPDKGKLFGPGYLLLDVIKRRATGSVFLALDMRDSTNVAVKVIKEGRAHCMSDGFGRDSRTRLKHQMTVHRALAKRLAVPAADVYFQVDENGYLALEYIDGTDIGAAHPCPYGTLVGAERQQLLRRLTGLAAAVDALHAIGYIHRDLTPTNVRVRSDGSIFLLDLELAHSVGSDAPPFAQGTAGFMSPEQIAGSPPDCAQDIYGFGALMVLLFTGVDPRRVLFAREQSRQKQLCVLGGLPTTLAQLVARCLVTEPTRRPSAKEVGKILEAEQAIIKRGESAGAKIRRSGIEAMRARVNRLLPKIARGLILDVLLDNQTGLWLSPRSGMHGPAELRSSYALHRSAGRGVAGVVYALGRLARFGITGCDVQDRVQSGVDWLLAHATTPDDQLPGLHFGEAGVALAIAESVFSGLVQRGRWLDEYLVEALQGPLDWPDVTHGAAGQGIAAIACGDLLQDERFTGLSRRCAQYLLRTQDPDGGWTLPEGAPPMSGSRYVGFAHGVAGEVYFLAHWGARFNNDGAALAAKRGADWLITYATAAQDPRGALAWPIKIDDRESWRWWCHGAPGIALTFLKMFEVTGAARYADIASAALQSHPPDVRYSNLSQCHGLSGLGEIYLEAARVLGEDVWCDRAAQIGEVILELGHEEDSSISWLVEDPHRSTADLMIGGAGVAHFLLRMCHDNISAPLLLPAACTEK